MTTSARPEAVLGATRPYLAESLASAADIDQLDGIARCLPACALSVGCECRLSQAGSVDLGLSVSPSNGGAQVLAGESDDRMLERAVSNDDCWRRLRDFARAWTDPASPLLVRVPFIFLEFDAGGSPNGVPIPSVFLGLDWPTAELSREGVRQAQHGLRAILDAAASLRSESLAVEVSARVHEFYAALPVGGVLLHTGVMLSRPGESLRLSVIVPRAAVAVYLAAVGREACVAAVVRAIGRYAPLAAFSHPGSHVQLDFDAAGADTRLGVTLCPPRHELWPLLLALLCEDGLCEREKGLGLLRWPGVSDVQLAPDLPACSLRRSIEHVKLVFAPELTGAKVYFGATPEWPATAVRPPS